MSSPYSDDPQQPGGPPPGYQPGYAAPAYPQQPPYPQQQPGYSGPAYPEQPAYPQQPAYPGGAYPPPGYDGYGQPQRANGMAVAGLVCGIIGLVFFWFPILGMVLAVLGIIFGGVGISRANSGAPNKGLAIAGLVCGVVAIALYVIIILVVVHTSTRL